MAQTSAPDSNTPESNTPVSTLHITSHAVLIDVVVTDRDGSPVAGLKQDAFSVNEEGKPQTVSFFEEHKSPPPRPQQVEMPELPPDVFTNFSPIPPPPAVTVLLLDSLNTPLDDQTYVHNQALKYLKTLRPGSRMAIFTMSMGLRFVQGFTDDPALLVAALGNKKTNEIETPALLKSPEDTNAQNTLVGQMTAAMPAGPNGTTTAATQAMIDALTSFFTRTDIAQEDDRAYRTLANLQHLAAFLDGFPGRKNLIWFSEKFPLTLFGTDSAQFAGTDTRTETRFEDDMKKTIDLLTAARVAVYPVDARGVKEIGVYEAGNNLSPAIASPAQFIGVNSVQAQSMLSESGERNADQEAMKMLAHDSGGKAFVNTNGFSQVVADIVSTSSDFYTISYTPQNRKMDGTFRRVEVKVNGGKYNLAYRRGYYADDLDLPGATRPIGTPAAVAVDPLLPYMDFGMPQTEQILYKTLVQPIALQPDQPGGNEVKDARERYSVDFAVDLNDLRLTPAPDGLHKGTLNVSLIVYDRYGNVASRKDHIVALNIKPDVYAIFEKTGVQLHDSIEVPKGMLWLRTGVYDQASHKVGTLEIPLNQVRPLQTAAK